MTNPTDIGASAKGAIDMSEYELIKIEEIKNRIYTVRGVQVMLDKDLATFYEVKPIRLREQVKRNIKRFPSDFMFQLTGEEVEFMVSQNAIPSKQHLGGSLPYVFTEQGVAAISSVLTSDRAIEVNIHIMRAFVITRRFLLANAQIFQRLDTVEKRQIEHKAETEQKFEQIFRALEDKSVKPEQGIFFDGQIFDAYAFVCDLIRSAKQRIILIDNYLDESVLLLLAKRKAGVSVQLLTKNISRQLAQDIAKFNAQYPAIEVQEFKLAHDRFLIIDDDICHIGASLKDLGKKWFAFSKMQMRAIEMLGRVQL
ncbi:ORF6N domain-containing protein [Methylotuvimicrobium sp. KM2]|uniref:ORF6N domain-containing protein n=1 Tax=Methylotuvimicrobium sp. KM2 TaxID=3133976 RepID=UPI00310181C3